ncbi:hypothetical protein LG634_07820 [Streptomyces bambusae]|uniref:hypothetical protein n=1 Tax=Streptomyces bambusae TaxID=1550616 RepID=UPI001CFDC681|nr:hypothetical protein [Streptomyces bambusae]MCB5164742.1 hypothetical protein [Streptomyces bambusae]
MEHPLDKLFREEMQRPLMEKAWQEYLKNQSVLTVAFNQELANQGTAVAAKWADVKKHYRPRDARYENMLKGKFLDEMWQNFLQSQNLDTFKQQFLALKRQEFQAAIHQNPQAVQAAVQRSQAGQNHLTQANQQVPVQGATVWNPTGANNNCVHVCVAYILGGGGAGFTAERVAETYGIPVASPGTLGIDNADVLNLVVKCGLWKNPQEYTDLEMLKTELDTLAAGEDPLRLGYHMLVYSRGGSGHAVILNLKLGAREWIEPQLSVGANVADIEGIAAGGAEWWLLLGPFWK